LREVDAVNILGVVLAALFLLALGFLVGGVYMYSRLISKDMERILEDRGVGVVNDIEEIQ
jgi:hypothetical protein